MRAILRAMWSLWQPFCYGQPDPPAPSPTSVTVKAVHAETSTTEVLTPVGRGPCWAVDSATPQVH